jgi:hypothetical protein
MSIVAMKRKSRGYNIPISANSFSLNGGLRNVGIMGQTNLMRSKTRCGADDARVIKRSTKNTLGQLESAFNHPICANGKCPSDPIVKQYSPENQSQGVYIENLTRIQYKEEKACPNNDIDPVTGKITAGTIKCVADCNLNTYIGGRKIMRVNYMKDLNLDRSSEEYMRTKLMQKKCIDLLPPTDFSRDPSKKWVNNNC